MFFYAIGILIGLFISTVAFWLAGRFSSEPPNFLESFIGTLIIEAAALILREFGLFGYLIVFIVAWIVFVKIARMEGVMGFFGALVFGALQLLMFFFLAMPGA